jgi:hypothetical protein
MIFFLTKNIYILPYKFETLLLKINKEKKMSLKN